MKIMGLDFGLARIGVSVSDALEIAAHPAPTVSNDEEVFERLRQIACERDVEMIVLGLPLNMDGSEGGSARKVRSFAKQLRRELPDLPVEFYDERLSTHEAHEALSRMGADPRTRREQVDGVAAQLILQRYLESRRDGAEG
jgi:putative Holliday junction resolvase